MPERKVDLRGAKTLVWAYDADCYKSETGAWRVREVEGKLGQICDLNGVGRQNVSRDVPEYLMNNISKVQRD